MPTKIGQCVLLALWAGFFLWLIGFGQPYLARLLHPKLWWLLGCGAVVLVLFFAVGCTRSTVSGGAASLKWRWPSLLILAVPLLYGSLLPTARFDARTFAQRAVQVPEETALQEVGDQAAAAGEDEVADAAEVPLTRVNAEAAQYAGKEVEAVCQGMRDPQLPDDLMICYRFLISCCAADARPVFVLVKRTEQTFPANDAWVRVKGRVSLYESRGFRIPMITADTLATVKEPAFPFLF